MSYFIIIINMGPKHAELPHFDGDKSKPSMCILLNVQETKNFRICLFIQVRFSYCHIIQLYVIWLVLAQRKNNIFMHIAVFA